MLAWGPWPWGLKAGKTKGTLPGGAAALGTVFQFPVNHQLSLSNPRISSQPLIKMEPYLSRTAALSVHQGQSQGKAGKEGINSHHRIVLRLGRVEGAQGSSTFFLGSC